MDSSLKILCSICARGGSKGVKGKNIRLFLDKPLIAHSIIQAKATGIFTDIAVSSDSDEILEIAQKYGANILVKREKELSQDDTPKVPVIRQCFLQAQKQSGTVYDLIVDLDCTSPLREVEDIRNCVELLMNKDCMNVITGCVSRRSPYFNMVEVSPEGNVNLAKTSSRPFFRRQDVPVCYDLNASIYGWRPEVLLQNDSLYLNGTRLYVMPPERSVDIDSEFDFLIVEYIAQKKFKDDII